MTIFIKAAKLLMDRALNKSLEDAITNDQGYLGGWRDSDLSEKQKAATRNLQKHIDAFTDKDSDENSLATLKALISAVDSEVEAIRKIKSKPRGHLNKTLETINSELERFYNSLAGKIFKLIDIADDDDPFDILCAHAAYYLGEDIFYPAEENMVSKTINAVSKSTVIEIRTLKEDCLIRHLTECKKKLDGLDKEGEQYEELRQTFVIQEIEAIQRENAKICKDSQLLGSIPISLTFLATANVTAPKMKPSRGRLEVSMQNALEEIQSKVNAAELAV